MGHRGINIHQAVLLFLSIFVIACQQRQFNQSNTLDSDVALVERVNFERQTILSTYRFDRITPTGEKLFAAAQAWAVQQEAHALSYAQPAQSLNNISRVLEIAGLRGYSSPVLWKMLEAVVRRGGMARELPKSTRAIARIVEDHFEGALPVGAFIIGCSRRDCSGETGDGHVGIVGQVDDSNALHLWHNNWFRPENRPWRSHMIPLSWYQAGFLRKWMSTPWISRVFDAQGKLADIKVELPEISSFDPSYDFVILMVLPEILTELKEQQSVMTDGRGAVMPFRARSILRPDDTIVLPPEPVIERCRILKTSSKRNTNLREQPNGKILCQLAQETVVELEDTQMNWSKVRTVCPDGKRLEGFTLSALLTPDCGK